MMNSTIYNATIEGPVLAILGENQTLELCPTVYLFKRPVFPNGMVQTLPMFAMGVQHIKDNDEWKPTKHSIIRNWSEKITVLKRL